MSPLSVGQGVVMPKASVGVGSENIPFTRCPVCGGELRFGSNDPCEGSYYWCVACGDGPICFPLYGGPKPVRKIAAVIDADKVQEQARIERFWYRGSGTR